MATEMKTPAGGPGLSSVQTIDVGVLAEYIAAGLALVALKSGTKTPASPSWQKAGNGITHAFAMDGVGIHHLDSHTCCIDVDDFHACAEWFASHGCDLTALLAADDAVQIRSGREGRAKLLYRLPEGVDWLKYVKTAGGKLELRCANSPAQSQQDVLPPSVHPTTGKPYTWGGVGDWRQLPTLPDGVLSVWQAAIAAGRHAPAAATAGKAGNTPTGEIAGGSRNATLTSMAGAMRRKGFDAEAIGGALLKHNATHCDPPLSNVEVTRIAQSVARYAPADDPPIFADNDEHPDLSHDSLALRMGTQGGWNNRARYVAGWGAWLFWDGARWAKDDKLRHMTECRDFLRRVASDLQQWAAKRAESMKTDEGDALKKWAKREARTLRSEPTRNNIETMARSNPELVASADQFDANPDVIGTPGGVVDLRTGTMRPATRDDYLTRSVAVAPADREPARWLAFLHESMDGDAEMVAFLQRLCGYALTGHTREQKLLFAFGEGGTGKSTFADTLTGVMGSYAARVPVEALLESRGSSNNAVYALATLAGARLVVGSELPAGRAWSDATIKDLTGSDPLNARAPYGGWFTFDPLFTLLAFGNHMPAITAVDSAIARRMVLIPFAHKVPESKRVQGFKDLLRAEWPGILQWAIAGAVAWYREGLQVPGKVTATSAEYLDAEDVLGQFMDECLEQDTTAGGAFSSDVHAAYAAWMERQHGHAMTQRAFSQAMRERGVAINRFRDGRRFVGWRVKPDAQPAPVAPYKSWMRGT